MQAVFRPGDRPSSRPIPGIIVGMFLAMAAVSTAAAAPAPEDPKKQTAWGLYLTSVEAAEMKRTKGDKVLFVDVREPVEIMFTGYTDMIDINIPFMLANPAKWNPKKPRLAMERNPAFADMVDAALKDRGLPKDTPVLLMCRSGGTRGAPSAKALEGRGLKKVYVVTDGFEGSTDKTAPNAPWRNVNGWKNSGLPWSYDLNPEKIYLRSSNKGIQE